MFSSIRGRVIAIVLMSILSAYTLITKGMTLGLDLQGGMYLALEIDDPQGTFTPEAVRGYIDQTLYVLRNRIDQFGVTERNIQKSGDDRIIVELPGIKDEERAKNIINQQAFLEFKLVRPSTDLVNALPRMDRAVVAAGPQAGVLPEADTSSADTAAARRRSVQEQLFGRRDTAAAADTAVTQGPRPLSNLIQATGVAGEFAVLESDVPKVKQYLALPGVLAALPRGAQLRWDANTQGQGAQLMRSLYILEEKPFITGERLEKATPGRDSRFNQTIVSFQLDRRGGNIFDDVTSAHIGDRIAIVLDSMVESAPVVQSRIASSGQIELGQAPLEEANDLALVLNAGALPATLKIMEQRSVGPSLGEDSIEQGRIAGIVGILSVLGIMVYFYRLAGLFAVLGLCFYVLFVLGGLAGFGATLTAPGIAGFVLSLGMAVDANVLIFERIREELLEGRSNRVAIDAGFKQAMSAIVDSNLTTVITGLILYQVGTGPVRGFAVTLTVGVIASFVTAIFVTRTIFMIYLQQRKSSEPLSI
jgi:protein-export membrane protein SecD